MKLYENVVIGNFLYGLGFSVRSFLRTETIPGVVNLLQQSPADHLLADVLITFPGVMRLIEFKSKDNKSNKERIKHHQLLAGIGNCPKLFGISRSVHWFVETVPSGDSFITRTCPYVDAFNESVSIHSLEHFVTETAKEACRGSASFTPEEQQEYLALVRNCQGGGDVATGGLMLLASADGRLRYAQLLSMTDLRFTHRQWLENYRAHVELAVSREEDLTVSRNSKLLDRGMSR